MRNRRSTCRNSGTNNATADNRRRHDVIERTDYTDLRPATTTTAHATPAQRDVISTYRMMHSVDFFNFDNFAMKVLNLTD